MRYPQRWLYVNKNFYFGCDLIAINRLTALVKNAVHYNN